MAKVPPDCPKGEFGERVQHRAGRERIGTIVSAARPPGRTADDAPTWITVKWDGGARGPRIVHLHELRLLPDAETKAKG